MPRLTARERREGYLREHGYQKATGKRFFPFATIHDTIAALFFILLILGLTLVWYFGANSDNPTEEGILGPLYEEKADPATEEYEPKPDWYFFFLFQLLRIFDKPELLLLATIIIPTIWMVLLISMPFIDRSRERRLSRRPIATGFAGAMAVLLLVLTYNGSKSPGAAEASTALTQVTNLQCTTCHTLAAAGWNGNVGPNLDGAAPTYEAAVDIVTNGRGAMPAFGSQPGWDEKKIACVATFVSAWTNGGSDEDAGTGGAEQTPTAACEGVE
jgi:menaquinol-cytochrome c reductase cytochrome b/c subunit